jgi:Tfp pilus assembly protein PilX
MKLSRGGNEEGFVIVAALLTLLILMAIATLIYTVTTKDARISIRRVGEQKAFAAAEAGIHAVIANVNATTTGDASGAVTTSAVVVDSSDPNSAYSISTVALPAGVPTEKPLPGYETGWVQKVVTDAAGTPVQLRVTGTNTQFNTSVAVDVGVGFAPIHGGTEQPAAGG